jgi:hypothetical protein
MGLNDQKEMKEILARDEEGDGRRYFQNNRPIYHLSLFLKKKLEVRKVLYS